MPERAVAPQEAHRSIGTDREPTGNRMARAVRGGGGCGYPWSIPRHQVQSDQSSSCRPPPLTVLMSRIAPLPAFSIGSAHNWQSRKIENTFNW
jgi:hypothetical protein